MELLRTGVEGSQVSSVTYPFWGPGKKVHFHLASSFLRRGWSRWLHIMHMQRRLLIHVLCALGMLSWCPRLPKTSFAIEGLWPAALEPDILTLTLLFTFLWAAPIIHLCYIHYTWPYVGNGPRDRNRFCVSRKMPKTWCSCTLFSLPDRTGL